MVGPDRQTSRSGPACSQLTGPMRGQGGIPASARSGYEVLDLVGALPRQGLSSRSIRRLGRCEPGPALDPICRGRWRSDERCRCTRLAVVGVVFRGLTLRVSVTGGDVGIGAMSRGAG